MPAKEVGREGWRREMPERRSAWRDRQRRERRTREVQTGRGVPGEEETVLEKAIERGKEG